MRENERHEFDIYEVKLFDIHTLEGNREVDLGIHGEYALDEEQAMNFAVAEIVSDFLIKGYQVNTIVTALFTYIHVYDYSGSVNTVITVWARKKR